jgi:hypothetical protein
MIGSHELIICGGVLDLKPISKDEYAGGNSKKVGRPVYIHVSALIGPDSTNR